MVVDAISNLCATDDVRNIYFGPRLTWAYAAFHIPSPKGLPLWWQAGVTFPAGDEELYTDRWLEQHFDPVVVMDLTYLDPRIMSTLRDSYFIDQTYPLNPDATPLTILRL